MKAKFKIDEQDNKLNSTWNRRNMFNVLGVAMYEEILDLVAM